MGGFAMHGLIKYWILATCILCCGQVSAQDTPSPRFNQSVYDSLSCESLLDAARKVVDKQPVKAIPILEHCIKMSLHSGDYLMQSEAWRVYAVALYGMNLKDSAFESIKKAIILSRDRNSCQYAMCLGTYANLIRLNGNPSEAVVILRQSIRMLPVCGDVESFMEQLYWLGQSYDLAGDERKAIEALDLLRGIARKQASYYYLFKATNSLLIVFMKTGKNPAELFDEMVYSANQTGDPDLQVSAWNNLSKYYAAVGDSSRILFCYNKAYEIARQSNDDENIALVSINLAMFHQGAGNAELARSYFNNAVARENYIVHYKWKAVYLAMASRLAAVEGNIEEAIVSIERAMSLLDHHTDFDFLIRLNRFAANLYQQKSDFRNQALCLQRVVNYQDSLSAKRSDDGSNNLYYKVLLDLEKEKAQSILLRNENLEKRRSIYLLLIITAIILLMLAGAIMYFLSNRFRSRILNAEQAKESLLAARIRLTNELNEKN